MTILYIANERFDPTDERWQGYIEWSGLTHLKEVISLDWMLCGDLPDDFPQDEDWEHFYAGKPGLPLFTNLDHLLGRLPAGDQINVLAVIEEPKFDYMDEFDDPRFEFEGFDLIDVESNISAIANCGGFEGAFVNEDLSEVGLIADLARATEIRQRLPELYPDHGHQYCHIWAIWRMRAH